MVSDKTCMADEEVPGTAEVSGTAAVVESQVSAEAPMDAALPAGVSDGTVDEFGETIVHEVAEDGTVTGWHKEPAPEQPGA